MLLKPKISSLGELESAIKKVNFNPGKFLRFIRKAYWALFVYYLRKNHISTVLTRNGLLHYESRDRTVGRILEVYRHFDFYSHLEVIEFMREIGVRHQTGKSIVVDVGGFIGVSSITFLHERIFTHAIAFEPNPSSYKLLEQNVVDNFLQEKVSHFNIALSDSNGSLDFELSPSNYGDHRVRHESNQDENHYNEISREIIPVKSCKFDDFMKRNPEINSADIKLFWVDIQGHEGRFLNGAKEFLTKNPHIPTIMEFWPYAILRSGLTKSEFLKSVQDVYSHYYIYKNRKFIIHNVDELTNEFERLNRPDIWGTLYLFNSKDTD
jgi:FkbM family methyltransferase